MKLLIVLCALVAVSNAKPGYLTGGIASLAAPSFIVSSPSAASAPVVEDRSAPAEEEASPEAAAPASGPTPANTARLATHTFVAAPAPAIVAAPAPAIYTAPAVIAPARSFSYSTVAVNPILRAIPAPTVLAAPDAADVAAHLRAKGFIV